VPPSFLERILLEILQRQSGQSQADVADQHPPHLFDLADPQDARSIKD
jgi:hypothetical protein